MRRAEAERRQRERAVFHSLLRNLSGYSLPRPRNPQTPAAVRQI